MKYIFQLCRILEFCFAGEICSWLLPLPIPASIYGLLFLLGALLLGLVKLEQVQEAGTFLTGLFALLFVPAAVGIMAFGNELKAMLSACLVITIPGTVLVMVTSGLVTQFLIRKRKERSHSDHDTDKSIS